MLLLNERGNGVPARLQGAQAVHRQHAVGGAVQFGRTARAALRQMYRQGSGSIINCASILGALGQSGTVAYSAAKGGVVNMTRTLAIEAAPRGVRVNSIGPGYIDTPLLKDFPDEMRQALIRLHPIGRLGRDGGGEARPHQGPAGRWRRCRAVPRPP